MNGIDIETLVEEIAHYLATVDAFRAEQCEPTWQPELWPTRETLEFRIAVYRKAAASAAT
jgi:hypothetical protein